MRDWKNELRQQQFVNAWQMVALSGLSKAWLIREAKAGRLPYIMVGRSMMFDHAKISELLTQRAQESVNPSAPPPCKPAPPNVVYNDCTMRRANVGP